MTKSGPRVPSGDAGAIAGTPRSPRLVTLVLLTAFTPLSLNMFLPVLPQIARDLQVSYGAASLSVSVYLGITALVQLVLGPLSDRIGRRPVVLGSLATFTLASVVCALSQDIVTFLAARLFQASMISGYLMSMAMVRDTRTTRAAAGMIGTIAMAMAVGPMLGPVIGGAVGAVFGWRACFWIYALGGASLLALAYVDVTETRQIRPMTQRAAMTLMREPALWAYASCAAFSVGAFYIFVTGAPFVAEQVFGLPPALLGVAVGSITLGFLTGSAIASRLATDHPLRRMMIAGRLVAVTGLGLGILCLMLGVLSPWVTFAATMCAGLANGLSIPSTQTGAMSIRPEQAGAAAGIVGALTVGIGATLTLLTGWAVSGAHSPALVLLCLMALSAVAALVAAYAAPIVPKGA